MIIINQSKQNPSGIQSSDITSKTVFDNRRHFIKMAASSGLIAGAALMSLKAKAANITGVTADNARLVVAANTPKQPIVMLKKGEIYNPRQAIKGFKKTDYGQDLTIDTYKNITTYNNYYEFGTDKADPALQARTFQPHPWSISIEGEVKTPRTIHLEDVMKLTTLEERIYRMRCVEGWSMVIPWIGLPLASLIKWAEPTGNAKYVEFVTANDRETMPGVNAPILDWPYTEGLRMDEAMHPLTLIAVGLYGELLPNQNGAPARLVVPWKYGFKGGKSIVKIRFVEKMPRSTWMKAGPREYGFYANVNPNVSHPRWSQSTERPISGGLFGGRVKTKMFNGYASEVSQLYAGMDLRKNF
jgi:methionine sulfoxide reductase catalytic subunit